MGGKYRLSTLGCKVNQYESQLFRQLLESLGLRPAARGEEADVAVVNTCAVTANALRDNRRAIRGVSTEGRTPVIVVGCGATADAERLRSIPGVAAVVSRSENEVSELRSLLLDHLSERASAIRPPFIESGSHPTQASKPAASGIVGKSDAAGLAEKSPSADRPILPARRIIPLPLHGVKEPDESTRDIAEGARLLDRIDAFAGHHRAFLKVQDGCDAFCTYCIIPRLRPSVRYKPASVAVAEAKSLVRAGYKEIVLTGIFLGAYGRATAIRRRFDARRSPLAELVDAVSRVEGLERLRLSSLEAGDVDDSLLDVLRANVNCVPHLHLPLQSGSEAVLRRMNRQYTRDDFAGMVDRVRSALDRPAISTDVIVGFPGESDADFEATLDLARHARFCKIHAFPFSPREGTAAARWRARFTPPDVVRARMSRLADVEAECSLAYRRSLLGVRERVLIECVRCAAAVDGRPFHDPSTVAFNYRGRADRYFEVEFESISRLSKGDLVPVRITGATREGTLGIRLGPNNDRISLPVVPVSSSDF